MATSATDESKAEKPTARERPEDGENTRTDQVARLRDALRDVSGSERQLRRRLEQAMNPLWSQIEVPLLRFCDRLARGAPQARLDGDDLALHAWEKILRYLTGSEGDRVQDDKHFERLLYRAARSRLLDVLDEPANRERQYSLETLHGGQDEGPHYTERLADENPTPEQWLLPADSNYLALVEELFTDERAFHQAYRQANQRHPRQYKALVFYQLGTYWRAEIGRPPRQDGLLAAAVRHWVSSLGIAPSDWQVMEQAAETESPEEQELCPYLTGAANQLSGAQLRSRATLSVLRHEMNRFAVQRATSLR